MNIRNLSYTILSKIKRTPVSSFIHEYTYSQKEKDDLLDIRLNQLIDHAKNNTSFYKNFNSFNDFPIINKSTLRDNYKSFFSINANLKQSVKMTTSGSTGQPMTFYLSKEKKYRQNAEVIYYNSWGKFTVGDCHGYVRVTNAKSKLKLFIQNEYLMNPINLTDEWLNTQVSLIKNKNISSLIGYPSAISAIARKSIELNCTPDDFHLKGIITSSETLQYRDLKIIEQAFNITPISRYSTEEFGVLASSCPCCGKYHVNDTGYYIEILDLYSDTPVKTGDIGRVIVTDLFSDYMPLIRFDTGDLATLSDKINTCSYYNTGITLDSIIGRQIETIYNVDQEPISAFAINGALRDFESIRQYQFIQNGFSDNILHIVTTKDFSDSDLNTIYSRLESILGCTISIKILDQIEPSKSGKRPYIISNILSNQDYKK